VLSLRSLLQEAGRRHVAKVAIVYAAVAFAVLEAADIIIPALGLPEWAIRWVIALALLGFPISLILAWIFDLTPGGVIRTRPLSLARDGDKLPEGGRPFVSAVLLLFSASLVAMAAFFAYEWSVSSGPLVPNQASVGLDQLDPLRVAVLPFVDLDETSERGFLANGIHDDILNQLAKIDALEVISRTSVLQYRDSQKSVQTIGRELGAGTILEGNVQRQGNRVRVVAQLIDVRTDAHLWSNDFNREAEDIFRVQSEIAQEIARALRVELTSAELEELEEPTLVSGPAYNKYAEGITQWDLRENRRNAERATELFQEAVDLAPDFAVAHAALSRARMWLFWSFPGFQDQAELARESLDRALDLAPNAVETLLAQGYFYFYGRGDSDQALDFFRRAEALKPSDADVISAIGLILRGQGRWEEAVEAFERARGLDLRSYNLNYTLADTYLRMRRFPEAESVFRLAANMAPEVPGVHRDLLKVRLAMSQDTVEARQYLEGLPRTLSPVVRSFLNAELAYYRGDFQSALHTRAEGGGGSRRAAGDSVARDSLRAAGVQPMSRPHERMALLYYHLGDDELQMAYADSLRLAQEAVLESARANPGPDQTVVKARAEAKLGIAYALLGEPFMAFREASTAVSTLPITTDAYEGVDHLLDLSLTLILIGETELALDHLETLLGVPSTLTLAELRLDPIYRPLQELPRFQQILSSVQ
jgi:TolB-like protein/Tfp pilus assembly protein PilF